MESVRPNEKEKMIESSGASSVSTSPSFSLTEDNYQVFLSFHAKDTHKVFTDHLYRRVNSVGYHVVFRDEESLLIGEDLHRQLHGAIARSKIFVPIISEYYPSSEWCLMELVEMMERKKSSGCLVLPIFYKVKPKEVRLREEEEGNFEKAFRSLQKEFQSKEEREKEKFRSDKWNSALCAVCSLKGWESEKFAAGYEGALVDEVVETILKELSKDFLLNVPEIMVGTNVHMVEIMRMLDISQVVVVHGMSGVGKTTLAKLVYNELSSNFGYRSFIPNIRESVGGMTKSIEQLQSQLIRDLGLQREDVPGVDVGINILQHGLKEKDVLILLDDVDDEEQLNALFGKDTRFSFQSRIIITTQKRDVLLKSTNFRGVPYELHPLTNGQDLILFSRYAFGCDSPPDEFKVYSRQVVAAAGGLPLALRVTGLYLRGVKDVGVWEETCEKYSVVPKEEVKQKLKLIFEKLNDETKQIFLDIACFFAGIDKRIPICMWDSCKLYPRSAIIDLERRSLINIGDNNEIQMHDQLRALGRDVVLEEDKNEPKNRTRVWDYKEALEVLEGKEGTAKTQAIRLGWKLSQRAIHDEEEELGWISDDSEETVDIDPQVRTYKVREQFENLPNSRSLEISPQVATYMMRREQFENLPKLRFLNVTHANFSGDFRNSLSELRWLRWKPDTLSVKVTNFHLKKLVILDLSGTGISEHWQGWRWIKMATQLKVLNLTNCSSLKSTPDLSSFKSLEILNLQNCVNLMQIESSIGDLKTLIYLNLGSCQNLKVLPPEVGYLEGLKELIIDKTAIVELPEVIGNLTNLEVLSAYCCRTLVHFPQFPSYIGKLVSLTKLNLLLTGLRELPESVRALQNLTNLDISGTEVQKLPSTIGRLQKLQVLDARGCCSLRGQIPEDFGELSSLEILDLSLTNISSLPESIHKLSSLRRLNLGGCHWLQSLPPELPPGLTSLAITCMSDALPQLSHLTNLRELSFESCWSLESIPELPLKLLKLVVYCCPELKKVPNLSSLQYLSILMVSNCPELTEIEGLEALRSLRRLEVSDCKFRLSKLYGLKNLGSLVYLDVGFRKEPEVPEETNDPFDIRRLNLTHLEWLIIHGLDSITTLDLSQSVRLKYLGAGNCSNLVEFRGLDKLKSLRYLTLDDCESLSRLADLPCCNTLKELRIRGCGKLCDIESLQNFSSCYSINIDGCVSLVKLPDLSNFKILEELVLKNCAELLEIPRLEDSGSLRAIDLSGCKSIKTLPDLSACKKLEYMCLRYCKELTGLQGLEDLEKLQVLDISGCERLKTIPKLPRTSIIQNYAEISDRKYVKYGWGIRFRK